MKFPTRNVLFVFVMGLLALGIFLPPSSLSPQPRSVQAQGGPWDSSQPIRLTTAEIMAMDARRPASTGPQVAPFNLTPWEEQADRSAVVPESSTLAYKDDVLAKGVSAGRSGYLAPQTLGTEFTSATLGADSGFIPPDTMGVVGPTEFVTHLNGRVRANDKTTGAVGALNATTNTFFSVVNGADTANWVDPRVRFDRLSDRWILTMMEVPNRYYAGTPPFPNRIAIAVSDGPSITGATVWSMYFFQQDLVAPAGNTGCLADYPTLGIDANALYIGANIYCPAWGGVTAWVVRKADILNPLTPADLTLTVGAVAAFRDLATNFSGPGGTAQGVDNFDPAATVGYFIGNSSLNYSTALSLCTVTNPGSGSPSLSCSDVTVPAWYDYISPPQQGDPRTFETVGSRLMNAHLRNGRLWATHAISVDSTGASPAAGADRVAMRWYEINVATGTLVQSGNVFDNAATSPISYWMGTAMVSGQGHVAMGFSASSTAMYASAATVGRLVGDPAGTVQGTPVIYEPGVGTYYVDYGTLRNRWGDYSMTSLDPCDDMTMWTIQEYVYAVNTWGVRVLELIAPPPASVTLVTPASVTVGQTGVTVTIDGDTSTGDGYYETPATGMSSCRTQLQVTVTNGVVVSNITFVGPNQITFDVDTTGATLGTATITITNPDGQTVTTTIEIVPSQIDLILTKTVSDPAPLTGDQVDYLITVTNNGPGDATGVVVTDPLPVGVLNYVSDTCGGSGTPWTWTIGNLAAGNSVNCTITVEITAGAGTGITNQATVIANEPIHDPLLATGLASLTVGGVSGEPGGDGVPGIGGFDPAISKIGQLAPRALGVPGEQITWTIVVTNPSGAGASDVVVTDTFPPELRIDSVTTSKGTFTVSGQTVTFTIGQLDPGETVMMQVVATVLSNPGTAITNTAMLTGGGTTRTATATVSTITTMPGTGYPPGE